MLKNEIDLSALYGIERRLSISETVELPAFGDVEFPYPVAVNVEIERSGTAYLIRGSVDVSFAGECNRCLGSFGARHTYEVDESFSASSAGDPFDDGNVLRDDRLDLTDLIRQVVDAALPLVKLCRDDCAGLCATCGRDLNEGTCDCRARTKDDHG